MDRFQFYPTYRSLAERAWDMFVFKDFLRVLEPSAGNGDLACVMPGYEAPRDLKSGQKTTASIIDCCEIDMSRHDTLRSKGLTVVGMDFMSFASGAMYSHCIMNPPFSNGAAHVLKAWEILWDAEIVAILNAETIRNPYTKERQTLVRLIEQHGRVEYVDNAFMDEEAERKAEVDIALVYLRKQAPDGAEILGDLLAGLSDDKVKAENISDDYKDFQQVCLPRSSIENMVLTFDAAVVAMKESLRARARAHYYMNLIGETMAVRNAQGGDEVHRFDTTIAFVQRHMIGEYLNLKDRAWSGLLRSANVTSRLSSKAQKRVESQFENIKKLEFSLSNIYGFLCGIVEAQGEIQIGMACDVFDEITAYHSDNTVYYKGWKSNDRHRTCGIRIKGTRFVLPGHSTTPRDTRLDEGSRRMLSDFDKVFAMLDAKVEPEVSLVSVFADHFQSLRGGARVSSSYFDVRYYPGVGTIHFFPRDVALMDRLNRLVGRQRDWLPPESARVSEAFWLQYDKAEKFDSEVRAAVKAAERLSPRARDSIYFLSGSDDVRREEATRIVDAAINTVLEKHGISTEYRIEAAQDTLLLAE